MAAVATVVVVVVVADVGVVKVVAQPVLQVVGVVDDAIVVVTLQRSGSKQGSHSLVRSPCASTYYMLIVTFVASMASTHVASQFIVARCIAPR